MTRDEMMKYAREQVDEAFSGKRNRMMNLVEQAWAEGKRNAETEAAREMIGQALQELMAVHNEDTVQVVRCKDCKHGCKYGSPTTYSCIIHNDKLYPGDWYCAYGEKEEEKHD